VAALDLLSRIRLSDKTSRLRPWHVAPKGCQAYEPEVACPVRWSGEVIPVGRAGLSSHHFVHGHSQPTETDALTNRPYKPCCRRNEDEATSVGKGGKKSAGADQSVANASAESRENKMRTMMTGSYRGRQRCHRQRRR